MSEKIETLETLRRKAAQLLELSRLTHENAQYMNGHQYQSEMAIAHHLREESNKILKQADDMEQAQEASHAAA